MPTTVTERARRERPAPLGRAMPLHWTPLDRERAGVVLECTRRVLADSNRTLDIVAVEEITAQAQLAYLVDRGVFDTGEGRALLADRPHLADTDLSAMRALPDGTLGREWSRFLDAHRLDPSLTKQPTPYTDDPVRAYLMHRIRQAHDLWHVLLDLGTRGHEEVLVHSFSLAQTGLPSSVAIVVLGALKHMVLERRWSVLRRDVLRAHRRGVRAAPLLAVYWERHLERRLDEVRAELNVRPMSHPG
ncbi:MAG: ubiquinone biosynthesis protein COQ4 [Sandaracinaceae bacterium]|nr:ubiquinone biosynthesis protein COQ4 [Sandaracinaceae bacterium]